MARMNLIRSYIPFCCLLMTISSNIRSYGHYVLKPLMPEDDQKSSEYMLKRLPEAIIIGAKKAGTRAVLEYLRLHSMVKAAGPEIHFFDRNYAKGLRWYRDQMPVAGLNDVVIEKTPKYFVTKEAPMRIKRMNPNVKLIVVVRDPVTRALSEYTQVASKRPGMVPFECMAFVDINTGRVNTSWHAIDTGLYAKHVSKWLDLFPRSNILFVNGEKLVTDPANETKLMQSFLGLPTQISEANFDLSGRFPCLRKSGSSEVHCLGRSKGRLHPSVNPRVLKALAKFYQPYNERFFRLAGQNFSWPTY